MTANEALAELLSLSSQVRDVAILGESGFVLASTGTAERGEQLARVATDLVEAAQVVRPGAELARIEVTSGAATVFLVRDSGRTAIATAVPEAIAGLVIYDLRTMLGRLDTEPAPTRARRKKKESGDAT
jgi:hypothetical protein